MRLLRSILLALLISLTSWLGGCDDEDEGSGEEPPVAGEVAGEAAGEELPLDQGVTDAGESAGDQDVSGGDSSVEEDCSSEDSDSEDGCAEPEAVPVEGDVPES